MRNGFTLMLRDRPAAASSSGVRLLVASEPAPVQTLSTADIGAVSARIVDADLLFVDGYVLLSPASRQSARLAVELAREHGTLVALDLVPHDLDRRIGLSALMPLLPSADLVVSDARTVAGLFGVPANGAVVDFDRLLPALDTALPSFPLWLLRHGDGGMQDTLAYQNGRMKTSYETGYTAATEKAGFGDVIAARELHGWLSAAKG
jgi:sugar/nucleoside kinase (ribokinase family)